MDDFKQMMEKLQAETQELCRHLQHSSPAQLSVPYIKKKVGAIRLLSLLAEEHALRNEERWLSGIAHLRKAEQYRRRRSDKN